MLRCIKISLVSIGLFVGLLVGAGASAQTVKVGEGVYLLAPRAGDPKPPLPLMRTEALSRSAAQTNQWYSSLLFDRKPEAIYAQPLAVLPTAQGLEVSFPMKSVVPTERKDVEIQYLHSNPVVVSPSDFEVGTAKLAKASDWAIDIDMSRNTDSMVATVAHGSPYVFFKVSKGGFKITLPSAAQRVDNGADARSISLRFNNQTFAFFASQGARWEQRSDKSWLVQLLPAKGYLAVAALPDQSAQSAALIAKHAYAFTTDSKVSWKYDEAQSKVETQFELLTEQMEGENVGALVGLYPHHWYKNESVTGNLGPAFDTLRGKIHLYAGNRFSVTSQYRGFVPYWPAVSGPARMDDLNAVMRTDLRNARRMMLEIGNGPYWQGKGLQRISKLMDVMEQQGNLEARDQLLILLKERVQEWFSGTSRKTYFHVDKTVGTLLAYPEEYFSVQQLNDHHFHYGYWIRAMADIALRDPEWASSARWGGMVDLMVDDIATTTRGGANFSFLRAFDVYEGHSWASGVGLGPFGNNQESSSEAINAWAALIMWGELTGNKALRDVGIYLYTSESEAIRHYWFDVHGIVLAPEYKNVEVSMLFGAKYSHNTWWTDEPRQIKGINLLPITTASVYLSRDGEFIKRSLATLKDETAIYESRGKRADPKDIWQDIFAKYMALADPKLGLEQWNRWGAVEFGDTRTHTLHWLMSLNEMGLPDLNVRADTPFYTVFRSPDGKPTYLAFNARKVPLTVKFSDGKVIQVPAGKLVRER